MGAYLTQLQVYNRALDALGARAQLTSTTAVTPESNVLNDNYQNAFNMLLSLHDWSFARTLTPLTAASSGNFLPGWTGCWLQPGGCLVFLGISNGGPWGTQPAIPFEVANTATATGLIGTNAVNPVGVYTASLSDPSVTSPLFCDALVYALAAQSALDITESAQLGPALMQTAMNQLQNAIQRDGVQRRIQVGTRYDPDWLMVRR